MFENLRRVESKSVYSGAADSAQPDVSPNAPASDSFSELRLEGSLL